VNAQVNHHCNLYCALLSYPLSSLFTLFSYPLLASLSSSSPSSLLPLSSLLSYYSLLSYPLLSHRSLLFSSLVLNMSYQEMTPDAGKYEKLCTLMGTDLLGMKLNAPNAEYDIVYCLPLLTISMNKGTGVVTSVPSDAPDGNIIH